DHIQASPFRAATITSNIERVIAMNRLSFRQERDAPATRRMPQSKVLVLAAGYRAIESAKRQKNIARDRHIRRRAKVASRGQSSCERNLVLLQPLTKPAERRGDRFVGQTNRAHCQHARPVLMRPHVCSDKIRLNTYVVIDEDQ